MTIFQIQCFLNVAEYLNFTEAANHLFVAQSSLSRNVSNLEEELGMKLFVRTKKYVRLTSSGAILYEEFSKLMKLGEAAVRMLFQVFENRPVEPLLLPVQLVVRQSTAAPHER